MHKVHRNNYIVVENQLEVLDKKIFSIIMEI